MATPLPPDINVNIYQLEENPGGTDLQKKVDPAQVVYSTQSDTNDFELISLSDVAETIEIDKGVYLIDSVSIVIDGLPQTFFQNYSDPLNEPFVCEIVDNTDGSVIFHGPIDRKSIKFNARSQYHSFDILSWTYVLEQTSAAARSVYETRLTKRFETTGARFAQTTVTIPRIATNGDDMQDGVNNRVVVGDVVVFDSTFGEYRSIIVEILTVTSATIQLRVLGEPNSSILQNFTVTAGNVSEINTIANGTIPNFDILKLNVVDAAFYGAVEEMLKDVTSDDTIKNNINDFLDVSITFSTGLGQQSIRLFPSGNTLATASGQEFLNPNNWLILDDGITVVLMFDTSRPFIDDARTNGVTINQVVIPTEVKKGSKIRILGKDVYGYSPTGLFSEALGYEVDQVIEGLFSLAETGIFQYVANSFVYPAGFTSRTWHRWLEWPSNLIKSLRLMQNTEQSFLKIIPTIDGGGLPRITVELIDRRDVNETALGSATAITGIIDYSEDAADMTPRGITTKPHIKYKQPHGFKVYNVAGFFSPETITVLDGGTADPKLVIPPEGSDVPIFTVNLTPEWNNGELWVSNEKGLYRPKNLEKWAKFFYDFYVALPRNCEFKHDGKLDKSLLGRFVNINEGGLVRTIFVTRHSFSPITRDTTISGRVGSYTPVDSDPPVAIVEGDNLYLDLGATGLTDIWASGMASFSPLGLPLTYSWVQDPDGAATVVSTDPILQLVSLPTGAYVFELTVNDGTNSDSVRHLVFIGDDADNGSSAFIEQAQITSGPIISVDVAGNVSLIVSAEKALTQDVGSIIVESSLISATGPWTGIAGSPFNNPITTPQLIFSGLSEGEQVWFRLQLKNRADGSTSENVYVVDTNNNFGVDSDNLLVGVQLAVQGDFIFDSVVGKIASFKVDAQEFMLINDLGILFDLGATDTYTINNSTGMVFEISDTGVLFDQLPGDSFIVKNNLTSGEYLRIDDNGVSFGNINVGDFYKITHNTRVKFLLDTDGYAFDVDGDNVYTWSIGGFERMRIQTANVLLAVDLNMGTNDISGVGNLAGTGIISGFNGITGLFNLSGTGTISGFTVKANNVNFGPGMPDSITVRNGIVTAMTEAP